MTRSTPDRQADTSDIVIVTDLDPITPADRERWLARASDLLRSVFESHDLHIPVKLRVTCGFPSAKGLGKTKRRIGECWSPKASTDGTTEIFISPMIEERELVLATLIHELVHAAVGLEAKHGPVFKRAAKALGLVGKATATEPGPDFLARYSEVFQVAGAYPHHRLNLTEAPTKPQTTRMIKCECTTTGCGYVVRSSMKQLRRGIPLCPVKGCGGTLDPDINVEDIDGEGQPAEPRDDSDDEGCARNVERGYFPE